jgi:hypothetical protein
MPVIIGVVVLLIAGGITAALLLTGFGVSSMENKLVGEWQSSGQESVRLKIAKVGTNKEGFHNGYSSTRNGQTDTKIWRIDNGSEGPVLFLQGTGYWDDFAGRTGNAWMSESRYRIIDLTSDRLVVKWIPILGQESGKIQEFQRVK